MSAQSRNVWTFVKILALPPTLITFIYVVPSATQPTKSSWLLVYVGGLADIIKMASCLVTIGQKRYQNTRNLGKFKTRTATFIGPHLMLLNKFSKECAFLLSESPIILNLIRYVILIRTSRKRPPNMSSPGGRLREVVAYESFDHIR